MVWLVVRSEDVAPLVLFEKDVLHHHRYIEELLLVALGYTNRKLGNNWTIQQNNGTIHTHQETGDWCFQHFLTKIRTWPTNSPDVNRLDDWIWDELAQTINWNKVIWKSPLISELKRGMAEIRLDVVNKSCSVWTTRLYDMKQNDGSYLRE